MALSIGVATAQAEEFVTIGTGGVTGVYYPTDGSICRLMNKNRKETGVHCTVESTGGSVYNINTIREGELEFGVAQSDWQFHALNGTSKFEEAGPFEDLRAVFSVHAEPFNVMVRAESGIEHFDDLAGKRVNIGNLGSGQRGTMEVLMDAKGWTKCDPLLQSLRISSSNVGRNRSGAHDPQKSTHARTLSVSPVRGTCFLNLLLQRVHFSQPKLRSRTHCETGCCGVLERAGRPVLLVGLYEPLVAVLFPRN